MEQVGGHGQETFSCEPVGLVAQILAHPQGVVNDDDPRPWARARRSGQIGGDLPGGAVDRQGGHGQSIAPAGLARRAGARPRASAPVDRPPRMLEPAARRRPRTTVRMDLTRYRGPPYAGGWG